MTTSNGTTPMNRAQRRRLERRRKLAARTKAGLALVAPTKPSNIETLQATFAAAQQYHQQGQLDRAERLYRQVLEYDPFAPVVLQNLGALLRNLGRVDEAIALYEQGLQRHPDYVGLLLNLGNALNSIERFEQAGAYMRRALDQDPDNVAAMVTLGSVLIARKNWEEAETVLRRAVDLQPTHFNALINLGIVLIERENLEGALSVCQRAADINPGDAEACQLLGKALRKTDRLQEAVDVFIRALDLNPDDEDLYLAITEFYQQLDDFDQAETYLDRAARFPVERLDFLWGLAHCYLRQDRPDDAIATARKAVAAHGDVAKSHNLLGAMLREADRDGEAVKAFERSLELNPEQEEVHTWIANIHQMRGNFDKAGEVVDRLLARYPNSASARFLRVVQDHRAMNDENVKAIEAMLADPSLTSEQSALLLFSLGRLCDSIGRYELAFSYCRRGNAIIDDVRGKTQENLEKTADQLAEVFDRVLSQRPNGWGSESRQPVFIVGMPRSGTSLTEQIIASHPDAVGAGELSTMKVIANSLPANIEGGLPYPQCMETINQDVTLSAAEYYLEEIWKTQKTAKRITDKMPGNFFHLGLIAFLFPKCRIIHCRRDPLDTCISIYFQNFRIGHEYSFDLYKLGRYCRAYTRLMAHWRRILPVPMLEVDYEETVADLEGASRRLLEFCDLPWDDRVLRYYETERSVKTASLWQVRQPIYDTSVGRWRHYEKHLGPLMRGLAGEPPLEDGTAS